MKPDAEFEALLCNAQFVANAVAVNLELRGHCVTIKPTRLRATAEQRWQCTDEGDLEIRQRIEVKHWPTIDFHSIEELPYRNVIVDEVYKVDKRHVLPLAAYVIVNASMTGYLLVPNSSRPHWFKKRMHDRREGAEREFYLCPRGRVFYQRMRA